MFSIQHLADNFFSNFTQNPFESIEFSASFLKQLFASLNLAFLFLPPSLHLLFNCYFLLDHPIPHTRNEAVQIAMLFYSLYLVDFHRTVEKSCPDALCQQMEVGYFANIGQKRLEGVGLGVVGKRVARMEIEL